MDRHATLADRFHDIKKMTSNILRLHSEYQQSAWLDYLDRRLLVSGRLEALRMIGVRGVTSNPTTFHKAITQGNDYDNAIRDLLRSSHGVDENLLYEQLAIHDVQMAADLFDHLYASSEGRDGYVSLEVSPHLAYDTNATIKEARHLWQRVGRPNLMIKVPGTTAGLPAIEQLLAEGININITLLFSVARYEEVIQAFLRGVAQNQHPEKLASVASFFVSRIDTKVDKALDSIGNSKANALKGKIAIANAKMAYQVFKNALNSPLAKEQFSRGARMQRPLWASTGTKNPAYSDVRYVEQLIGPQTVNTMPEETLNAFLGHGLLHATLESDVAAARRDLDELGELGVELDLITQELEAEGVKQFSDSYDALLAALKDKSFDLGWEYVV